MFRIHSVYTTAQILILQLLSSTFSASFFATKQSKQKHPRTSLSSFRSNFFEYLANSSFVGTLHNPIITFISVDCRLIHIVVV